MTNAYRRSRRVAVLAAAATIGLAACGGSSNSPQVASLGSSAASGSTTTTTLPEGNATQLLDEWATCMRCPRRPRPGRPHRRRQRRHPHHLRGREQGAGRQRARGAGYTEQRPGRQGRRRVQGRPVRRVLDRSLDGAARRQTSAPARPREAREVLAVHARRTASPTSPTRRVAACRSKSIPGSDLNPRSPTFQSGVEDLRQVGRRTGLRWRHPAARRDRSDGGQRTWRRTRRQRRGKQLLRLERRRRWLTSAQSGSCWSPRSPARWWVVP